MLGVPLVLLTRSIERRYAEQRVARETTSGRFFKGSPVVFPAVLEEHTHRSVVRTPSRRGRRG